MVTACTVCTGDPLGGVVPAHCACNPVAQTSCDSGQKCAFADGVTTCVADGATAIGAACTVATSGPSCRDGVPVGDEDAVAVEDAVG